MANKAPRHQTITLTLEDAERLVRKIQGLESVLRDLIDYLSQYRELSGHFAASRMHSEMSVEDLTEWLREKSRL
jgi:hypothetical protein